VTRLQQPFVADAQSLRLDILTRGTLPAGELAAGRGIGATVVDWQAIQAVLGGNGCNQVRVRPPMTSTGLGF
jgi:hypothetical protein